MLWVHLFLIILYMIAFLTATGLWNHQDSRQFAYCTLILTIHPSKSAPKLIFNIAPASKAVRYRKMSYDGELDGINQFRGEPRPEVDKVWHDLLENNNIRLKKAELRKMNRTAIMLHDGFGYFGQLSAYHHLHCLVYASSIASDSLQLIERQKFLRQVLHSDCYNINTPDRDTHVGKLPTPAVLAAPCRVY